MVQVRRPPLVPGGLADDPRANRLLAGLAPGDYAALVPYLRPVRLRPGQTLIGAGEPARAVWFPRDCVVSLLSYLGDGRTAETGMIGREGVVGFVSALGGGEALVHTVVHVPGTAWCLERGRFRAAFDARPGVREACLRFAGALVAKVLQSVACNAHHPARGRLARWLLALRDRTGRDAFPLTHEQLAGMLGVQRTTVTEVLHALEAEGLVRCRRGAVEIADRAGLERIVCECRAIVKEQYERLLPGAFG
jgi:CRP-like cAMP-binding protein